MERFFNAFNELFYKILGGILLYAPIGVMAISAATFGIQGWATLKSLLVFTATFYLGLAVLWSLVYTGFLKFYGYAALRFFGDIKEAFATAFFTSSSLATLPVAISAAKKAGVSAKKPGTDFKSVPYLPLTIRSEKSYRNVDSLATFKINHL